jgi:hypothetical protein
MDFTKSGMLIKCCLLLLPLAAGTQTLERLSIDFIINGTQLPNPLTGGLNSPQFSAVDLNNNGILDLHVFDRVGDQHLTFLNDGTPGVASYTYAPEYADNFPPVKNWMLLRDFNGDGVMDIFSYSTVPGIDGVAVFTGFYENGRIAFEQFDFNAPYDIIFFPLPNGASTQLYVSTIDYPAVDDMDCDGDLDILTFNIGGGFVELYRNMSVEMGYGLDSLIFRREETCWGGFYESGVTTLVDLSDIFGECVNNLGGDDGHIELRHAGSTLLTFDADNDGDKELVLGDLSFNNLNMLTNGGNCQEAWMIEQDPLFPQASNPVNLIVYPASFLLDVNNDGLKDLLVSPNAARNAEDKKNVWYYENVQSNEFPQFEFRQNNFLVETMIDFGSGANPVFVDYNADGLLDLVVGNFSVFQPLGAKDARLYLFENVGTTQEPRFELVDDDYLSMNQFSQNSYSFAPTFGDLDGDGDLDILVGEEFGQLFFAENIAGPGNPMQFGPWQYGYMGIDVGLVSVPQIVDLNGDGLPDLVVGERNGNINYFQNIGSAGNPQFLSNPETDPNTFFLGKIDTRIPGYVTGYSSPLLIKVDGVFRLFTGSEAGQIEVYGNIENNLYGTFDLITETFGNIAVGFRTRPAMADINNDGFLEMIVGNERGGLNAFRTDIAAEITSVETPVSPRPRIFPNPATGWVMIKDLEKDGMLSLYNASGQLLLNRKLTAGDTRLELGFLPHGLYLLRINTGTESWVEKIVVDSSSRG